MRLRESRLQTHYHRKKIIEKDKEGCVSERYGPPSAFRGEYWPASGKVQAQQYGQRLGYIQNIKIDGGYNIQSDERGKVHYILDNGADITELDGICLFVGQNVEPDYKIVAIKPYRFLTLEVESLCQ